MKMYKCKYCGKPIRFEKDREGRTRAVERSVYYEPDENGSMLVLTMSGNIVRARECRGADCVGSVLHPRDCGGVSRYAMYCSFSSPKRVRRRGLVINEMRGAKAKIETAAAPAPQQVSLFD